MRGREVVLGVAAALVFAGAAAAQDVNVDWDKAADFSKYRTFTVTLGTSWGNQLSEKRVMAEVEEAIAAKGWKKAAEGAADTVIMVHGATQTKKNLNTFYSGYGGWGYAGWGGGGMGSAQTTVSEYLVGTLVVDIFDSKTKQLLFRGTATDEISDKPEKNVKKVEKATTKMFKNFPPQAKKT